jgi:hypothetical protein
MGQTLIRMSNKGSAWHRQVVLLLKGEDPGLARRMPERGTTGNQPSANPTYGANCIVAREEGFGARFEPEKSHCGFENGLWASSLAVAPGNGVKSKPKSDSKWPASILWHSWL